MKVEEIVNLLGFGRFHWRLILMGTVLAITTGVQNLAVVFYIFTPDHRCAVPGFDNDTHYPQSDYHKELINLTVPGGEDGNCFVYDNSNTLREQMANLTYTATTHTPNRSLPHSITKKRCTTWVYDRTIVISNAVSEFNLVCDNSILTAHGQMAFFAGFLVGSFLFGLIGDLIGRKAAALIGLYISLICSTALSWITNFATFMILRFVIGACVIGGYANAFVLILELVKRSRRILFSTIFDIGPILGYMVMVFAAHMVREWRKLVLVLNLPFLLLLLLIWYLPESLRWSLKKGKVRNAKLLLLEIAKENNIELPEQILDPEIEKEITESFIKIFTTPVLLKRFVILAFNWTGVVLLYYGLTLNSGNLGGNLYMNMLISVAIEIPGYFLVLFLIDRIGRKALHVSLMISGGVACIATFFPVIFNRTGLQWLILTLATIGKFSVAAAFAVIYLYTPELLPTTLRMSGLGSLSAVSRLGAIAAPYIVELTKQIGGDIGIATPLLVFGSFSIFCGLLSLMLPETKSSRLPETVDDIIHGQKPGREFVNTNMEREEIHLHDFDEFQVVRKEDGEELRCNSTFTQDDDRTHSNNQL